jgi:hypothetical protein
MFVLQYKFSLIAIGHFDHMVYAKGLWEEYTFKPCTVRKLTLAKSDDVSTS